MSLMRPQPAAIGEEVAMSAGALHHLRECQQHLPVAPQFAVSPSREWTSQLLHCDPAWSPRLTQ